MAENFIGFKLPPEQKHRLIKIAEHYKTTLSDLIINVVVEYIDKEKIKVKLDKNMRRSENMRKKRTESKETKEDMHELYVIKNCMMRIWDICHADYCLRRNINMGKVDVIRNHARKFYKLCSAKNKKLMKADMEAMMSLTHESIIAGLESRRLQMRAKTIKEQPPYVENRVREIGEADRPITL